MTLRIGSLFSGYEGLGMGAHAVLGGRTAWVSDLDPGPCTVLAHHYPDVPNLGDVTAVDWMQVEPVDVLTGGFPCQDVSLAGLRRGMRPGTRSGLWEHMAYAIDQLRPSLVLIENVRGLLSADAHSDLEPCPWCVGDDGGVALRALGGVLGDLAELGYDAAWCGLRAADVGAPHSRFRVFVLAWPAADAEGDGRDEGRPEPARLLGGPHAALGGEPAPTDTDRTGQPGRPAGAPGTPDLLGPGSRAAAPRPGPHPPADPDGDPLRQQPVPLAGGGGAPVAGLPGTDAAGDADRPGLERRDRASGPGPAGRGGPDGGAGDVARLGGCAPTDAGGHRRPGGAECDLGPAAGLPAPHGVHADRRPGPPARSEAAADTHRGERAGRERHEERGTLGRVPAARAGSGDRRGPIAWGPYAAAITRWERVLGRSAPPPTEPTGKAGGQRLSPRFVEFMMGLPDGHVTAVPGLTRNEQLKLLGNGVVSQQAAAALRWLLQYVPAEALTFLRAEERAA